MLESYKEKISSLIGLSDKELFNTALSNYDDPEVTNAVLMLIKNKGVSNLLKSKLNEIKKADFRSTMANLIIDLLSHRGPSDKSSLTKYSRQFRNPKYRDLRNEIIEELVESGQVVRNGRILKLAKLQRG
jgi:hypothetical protein